MRYLSLLFFMLVALAIIPCLCGCDEQAAEPDPGTPSVGDSSSEFEAPEEAPTPDEP